jgi:hypothetical protein
MLTHNQLNLETGFDFDLLSEELIRILNIDMTDFGFELSDGDGEKYADKTPGALKKKFIMPPFSVLDARQGDWQKRKKEWLKIINSGDGRPNALLGSGLKSLSEDCDMNLTGTSIIKVR